MVLKTIPSIELDLSDWKSKDQHIRRETNMHMSINKLNTFEISNLLEQWGIPSNNYTNPHATWPKSSPTKL